MSRLKRMQRFMFGFCLHMYIIQKPDSHRCICTRFRLFLRQCGIGIYFWDSACRTLLLTIWFQDFNTHIHIGHKNQFFVFFSKILQSILHIVPYVLGAVVCIRLLLNLHLVVKDLINLLYSTPISFHLRSSTRCFF